MKTLVNRKILFFGTPEFAVPSLAALVEHSAELLCVTMPDRPIGRKHQVQAPPVKKVAEKLGLAVLQPEKLKEPFLDTVRSWEPDVAVVAAYGKIFRPALLTIPRHGFVNVHPSLLPRHRGASPINETIRMGDEETGVTIMQLDEGLDTGPILAMRRYPLRGDETTGTLTPVLAVIGAELLVETLPAYLSGKLTPTPQTEAEATLTKILKKEDAYLDPRTVRAVDFERSVRAFSPRPSAWFSLDGVRYKVLRSSLATARSEQAVGTLIALDDAFGIVCEEGGVIALDDVQPENGRSLDRRAFFNGFRRLEGRMIDAAPDPE